MRNNINKSLPFILLILIFFGFLIISFKSEGYYGGGDNLVHYLYSKLAFNYHHLFLDHWGKPFFILLSSSFAQFGFNGIKVFNIIIGLLTALFTFLIAKELKLKNAWLVIVFTSFTPIYFIMHFTALTEILFSFVLILSIYLVIKNKYILSAIILSFLIFTRTEGIVILPLFWVFYLLRRKYISILFTLTAFVLYSCIGYFYYNEFFWFITKMPYSGAYEIYGSGSLFHFIDSSKLILGIPLSILLVVGILAIVLKLIFNGSLSNFLFRINNSVELISTDKDITQPKTVISDLEILLIILPWMAYLSAHSVAWWLGKGSSLGLIRVIAAVTPLMVLLSLKGYNFIQDFIPWKLLKLTLNLVIVILVVRTSLVIYKVPVELADSEKLVKEACEWLEHSEYKDCKIYYFDSHFWFFMGLDVYDNKTNGWMMGNKWPRKDDVIENSLLFWDTHFGPNEGRLPLNDLLDDNRFELIKKFKPANDFKVLGDNDYEIYVFKRKADYL